MEMDITLVIDAIYSNIYLYFISLLRREFLRDNIDRIKAIHLSED